MKITILYDNNAWAEHLTPDWGFACLVEAHEMTILFDTGANGAILLNNMALLGIDPAQINSIFISHDHWDHTGGLADILKKIRVPVYVPTSSHYADLLENAEQINQAQNIYNDIYSTGELNHIEQSLVVRENGEVVVVTGCSHPGVEAILQAASTFGPVSTLIGGLHGFNVFNRIDDLKKICPTHCTQHIREIAAGYPDKYIAGGTGKVIVL